MSEKVQQHGHGSGTDDFAPLYHDELMCHHQLIVQSSAGEVIAALIAIVPQDRSAS